MRVIDRLFFILFLTFSGVTIHAQDELYLQKDVKQGKITEISPVAVKYQNPHNSSQYLVPNEKILIIFNGKGDFLFPALLNKDSLYSSPRIAHFIMEDTSYAHGDQLFLQPDIRVEGTITKEDNNFFYLSDTGKVDKKSLVAVIYANGTHKLYGPADKAAVVLGHFRQVPVNSAVTAGGLSGAGGGAASGAAGVSSSQGVTDSGGAARAGTAKTGAGAAKTGGDSAAVTFALLAPNVSKKDFEEKATKKTEKFTEYLKILCDKTAPFEATNKAIDQAITLFINEEARVMVSSLNSTTIPQYKIRSYLTRLKLVKYDRIEVEWTNVQYVSDLRPGADGLFYGLVQFEQKFSGYKDGKLVYQDITVKRATVVLKTYEKSVEGKTQTQWDVLLGNVGVKSIQSL